MWNTKKSAAAVFSAMVLTLASVGKCHSCICRGIRYDHICNYGG